MEPTKNKVPKHVGIILDGNRRFAKKLMIKPWKGHEWGAKKIESLLTWCKDLDIREITLYCFSIENFNRPKLEFDQLMRIFEEEFNRITKDPRLDENKIKVNFLGKTEMFPKKVKNAMDQLVEKTKNNKEYTINFAMAYGGRDEIIDATKKIATQIIYKKIEVEDINKELFEKNLYMSHDPDLIIRTGGDRRSSNFLCYQSAYSEWFYLEKSWPEFEKDDFMQCIDEFCNRERRFGK
jgi:tritrans,polycis-undecaprenyl-diphosphate synthase [geranylgeranyl-diphosphate specific]